MDRWAPWRSGIEGPLHRLELALEAPDLAGQRLPSRRPTVQAVLHDGQEGAAPDALDHDGLHALVVAVLLRGELAGEARGQARLLAEEHGEEGAVGDDEAHVLPDDPAELVLRGQARAQDQAELPGESLDGLPGDGREHLVLGAEVPVERGLGHAEPPGDVVEGGGPVAALPKEIRRRAEDLVPDGL